MCNLWPWRRGLTERGNASRCCVFSFWTCRWFFMFLGKSIIITMGGNDLPFRAGSQSPGLFHGLKKKIFDSFQKQFRKTPLFSPIVERVYSALSQTAGFGLFHIGKALFLCLLISFSRIPWDSHQFYEKSCEYHHQRKEFSHAYPHQKSSCYCQSRFPTTE